MKVRRKTVLAMVLAASAGLLSTKQATAQEQADPPPHLEFFEAIAGVWDYKLSFPGGGK